MSKAIIYKINKISPAKQGRRNKKEFFDKLT